MWVNRTGSSAVYTLLSLLFDMVFDNFQLKWRLLLNSRYVSLTFFFEILQKENKKLQKKIKDAHRKLQKNILQKKINKYYKKKILQKKIKRTLKPLAFWYHGKLCYIRAPRGVG